MLKCAIESVGHFVVVLMIVGDGRRYSGFNDGSWVFQAVIGI